jgi:hypothetical protein
VKPAGKFLYYPVNLLRLAGQSEFVEQSAQSLHNGNAGKVESVHIGVHHPLVELIPVAQIVADHRLVETLFRVEEFGNVGRLGANEAALLQIGQALLGLVGEQLDARFD